MGIAWKKVGLELAQGLLQLVYPARCVVCDAALPTGRPDFCSTCYTALTIDPHSSCPRCASTLGPFAYLKDGCSRCRHHVFHFEAALRLGPYEGVLRDLILRQKHSFGESLAESVGILWATHSEQRLRQVAADAVVPVPLHWWRRLQRGYNQSEVLARALANRLALPYRPRWLRRIRHTPSQVQQTATARRENIRGAFQSRPHPDLKGKSILLVDDVITTGSTASEAARALCSAGAKRVVVAVLAHSLS